LTFGKHDPSDCSLLLDAGLSGPVARNDPLIPLILNNRAEFMTLPAVIARLVSGSSFSTI
jgi:hypothetical protein